MKTQIALFAASIAFAAPAFSEASHQPYKGFEAREITSLSQADIDELEEGAGWGLALPAELNGYPGPAHLIELAAQLGLADDQVESIEAIYDAMKADAVQKGRALIEAERALDKGFRSGGMSPAELKELIEGAETARAELRFVHLSRHLMTVELLTDDQVAEYAVLRGYRSDPCAAVPDGHDADMWRRHNGCE